MSARIQRVKAGAVLPLRPSRRRRTRDPAALASLEKRLQELALMFLAQSCEEPTSPHGLHVMHFNSKQLDKHSRTCIAARDTLSEIR
jgi:hypothetical protein